MNLLRNALIGISMIYLIVVAAMFLMQRTLQYFPSNKGLTPLVLGLSGVSAHTIGTPDGESIVVWYSAPPQNRPTILYFHGNAGEIGDRDERLKFYQANGYGACFVSYRGFGGSTGAPTEAGIMTDAESAYSWLLDQGVSAKTIALVGESLGTGVAVQIAARHDIGAIALEAPYTTTADIAAPIYWWLPVRLLMRDQFRSVDYVTGLNAPLLMTHGDADQVIPVDLGKRLFAAVAGPKELNIVPGGDHNSIHEKTTWAREVEFFNRVIRP